jgi:nucleoid-associated protein YgaU
MPPLDFSHSQPVDNSAMQPLSSASPDAGFAREVQSQLSASMAQPMPGAESMMGIPAVPGAEQAISPLVQMIMRMPGHIGLASSFFEVLGNFFLPQTDMLSMLDPANFGLHIDLSGIMPGDHAGLEHIDFSLLPHDAPLLDHIGHADLSSAHSLDLASDKLNLSLGGNSHFLSDHGSASVSMGSQFNVSGPASFASPKFEGAGGLVSGPSLSENFNANSLASNNRLFSDGAGIAHAGRNMMTQTASASSSAAGNSLSATAMPQTATASSLPANPVDNVSAHGSSANNVSYSVFENLAGNKDVLASNSIGDSYHSTVGSVGSVGNNTGAGSDIASKASTGGQTAGADSLHKAAAPSHNAHGTSQGHTASNENPGGLQAKSLSLDGSKVELKAEHPKLDDLKHEPKHLADAKHDAKIDAKAVDGAQHKSDIAASNKPEHAPEHKVENKLEHKAEHKVASADVKAEHKPEIKAEHKLDATSHAAKPAVAHHAAPKAPTTAQTPAPGAEANIAANAEQGQIASGEQNQFGEPAQDNAAASADVKGDAATSGTDKINIADKASGTGHGLEQQASPVSKVYTIRSGDCLWNIAKDQLGDATKWSDIYKMNGDVLGANPGMIRPGMSINLPGAESTSIGNIAHYTVKPGDNLWDIAKNQMGDSTKWGDLYKANQEVIGSNPSLIQPGTELTINSGAPDPASMQLSSAGTTPVSVAQTPAPTTAFNGAGDNTVAMSQNGYQTGFSGEGSAPIAHQGDMGAGQLQQQIHQPMQQPVSMQPAAKVMPVQAEPDIIIQPAHAAEISASGLSPEAANIAGLSDGNAIGQKGVVNTSTATDLLNMINKRK